MRILFCILLTLPTSAFASTDTLLGLKLLISFEDISFWIKNKAKLAEENARVLKLENDRKEIELAKLKANCP